MGAKTCLSLVCGNMRDNEEEYTEWALCVQVIAHTCACRCALLFFNKNVESSLHIRVCVRAVCTCVYACACARVYVCLCVCVPVCDCARPDAVSACKKCKTTTRTM